MEFDQHKIAVTCRNFDVADKKIKNAETRTNKVPLAAINELRSAGTHLVRYLNSADANELDLAVGHCKRACYDADELPVVQFLESIKRFKESFENVDVLSVLPDYIQYLESAQSAEDCVAKAAQEHNSRGEYYEELEKHVDVLSRVANKMDLSRPIINGKIGRERRTTVMALVGTGAAVVAAIAALLALK